MPSRRTNNFPESGRGLGHVTPTIFGNTVGYPSDSLASCFVWTTQIQARTQATIDGGWGNKSVVIVHSTLDGKPEAPTDLNRTARNESCLSLQWNAPVVSNGQITSYKVQQLLLVSASSW